MSAFEEIAQAVFGWRDLLQRQKGWHTRFRLDAGGLRSALTLFAAASVLNVLLQMLLARQFTVLQVLVNLALNVAPVAGLIVAVWGTLFALQRLEALFAVMVPAVWALAFAMIAGLLLTLLPLPSGVLLVVGLGYLYYRLGRMACGFSFGVGLSFAFVSVLLLVAVPLTLYMLVAALPGIS